MNPISSFGSIASQSLVSPTTGLGKANSLGSAPATDAAGPSNFKDVLLDSLRDVNAAQAQADRAVQSLATGGDVNPAEVLTAVQKADLALRTMLQIRNKLVQAFEEVKNIQV